MLTLIISATSRRKHSRRRASTLRFGVSLLKYASMVSSEGIWASWARLGVSEKVSWACIRRLKNSRLHGGRFGPSIMRKASPIVGLTLAFQLGLRVSMRLNMDSGIAFLSAIIPL